MGVYAWGFDLERAGKSVLRGHGGLQRRAKQGMFHCPIDLTPWSPDGQVLGFLTWEDPPAFLYDTARRAEVPLRVDRSFALSLKWAPRIPICLLVYPDHALVFDASGSPHCAVSWPQSERHHPYVFWWPDRPVFIALCQPQDNATPELVAFSAETGAELTRMKIDPAGILPFDRQAFQLIPREKYSLQVSPSTRSVGSLLDTWHNPVFDSKSLTLYAAAYRPTAVPFEADGELRCLVEEAWAGITLAA
jgi:hypothetical protein